MMQPQDYDLDFPSDYNESDIQADQQIYFDNTLDISPLIERDLQHIDQVQENSFVEDDSMIQELTRIASKDVTRDVDDLDVTVRHQINTVLGQGIDAFSMKLFSDIQVKTTELTKLTTLLRSFKVIKEHLTATNERNVRGQRVQVEDQQRSGLPIRFQVCDKAINPFVISFNETLILILNEDVECSSQILDAFDSYLRDQQEIIYIVAERVRDEILSLSVKFYNGQCTFIIKCGSQDQSVDHLQYGILKTYVALSKPFQVVTAFILYWADKRGLLTILPEFALQCMVIEFFQRCELLPIIFDAKYCFWPEVKKQQMKLFQGSALKQIDQELLRQYFHPSEYTLMYQQGVKSNHNYKRDVFVQVHFHTFPREDSITLIKEVWERQQPKFRRSQREQTQSLNYGLLVAKFFHSFAAVGRMGKGRIDITGLPQTLSEVEIGYQVMSPILPGHCLTRTLARQTRRDGSSFLPKAYGAVREEFERAYNLISQVKFKELNEKRQTFIQN